MVAITLAISAIVIGPPIIGSIILYGLFPLIGKRKDWRGLLAWDDRLLAEVTNAKEKARIVIIKWPGDKVRTMGILTSTFLSQNSEKQLAAVYVPTAPQTKLGYIRIVELEDVEFTDWTLSSGSCINSLSGRPVPINCSKPPNSKVQFSGGRSFVVAFRSAKECFLRSFAKRKTTLIFRSILTTID